VSYDKAEMLRFRLNAISILRLLKSMYSYKELAKLVELPETILCKYVKGVMIPSLEQAKIIWSKFREKLALASIISSRITILKNGYIDFSQVLADPTVLKLIAYDTYFEFRGSRITKVVTTNKGPLPLATSIALVLEAPLVIACDFKDPSYSEFYEEFMVLSSRIGATIYIPRRLLRKRDDVLIVTDIISKQGELRALLNIVRKAHCNLAGVISLVLMDKDIYKELTNDLQVKVKYFIELNDERTT